MTLQFVLTFLGWAFVLIPLSLFLGVSFKMIKGAAGDDETILALTLIGLTIFLLGAATLLLVYLTNLL